MNKPKRLVLLPKPTVNEDIINEDSIIPLPYMNVIMGGRICREFTNKAMWLNNAYDWHIGTDSSGQLILVATKK